MTTALPDFPYHPDPVATGVVVPSDVTCVCCGQQRGHVYTGPVYSEADGLDDRLCPWCIADGSAAERYKASFTEGCLGDHVPVDVILAVDTRTPGYDAWQVPQWFYHCGDGAAFLGAVGTPELANYPDAVEMLRQEAHDWGWSPEEVDHHLSTLDKDGQPTAYLFRCRVCGTHLAYSDFT
ncbi:CbrC family protein [Streptomyces gamaensis]|uniref:CbrC family protein n=1 Tax=Streptomyces gamaensis TaxID=1763542 RepID=A0ABW0Z6U6_9ACTN